MSLPKEPVLNSTTLPVLLPCCPSNRRRSLRLRAAQLDCGRCVERVVRFVTTGRCRMGVSVANLEGWIAPAWHPAHLFYKQRCLLVSGLNAACPPKTAPMHQWPRAACRHSSTCCCALRLRLSAEHQVRGAGPHTSVHDEVQGLPAQLELCESTARSLSATTPKLLLLVMTAIGGDGFVTCARLGRHVQHV